MSAVAARRLPVGAEILADGVHFRVWAPKRNSLEVLLESGAAHELTRENNGYFAGVVAEAKAGTLYKFRLDGGDSFPDPASRFQPEGVHKWSMVIDPDRYRWQTTGWRGIRMADAVLYEMHVGTFTPEGTYAAAEEYLPALADIGITVIEVMPVSEFAGRFGWGYDGVHPYAPTHLYGTPDDFRHFIDRAHSLGLAVILDVVYNHLGPSGNYLPQYSDQYFTKKYHTDWGDALNFDDEGSAAVREFFIENTAYWLDEFRMDGLRFDATPEIQDASARHVLIEMTTRARHAAAGRSIILIAENEPQNSLLVEQVNDGGYGFDGVWNDDFHHSARVALTGHANAYWSDYRGAAQELLSALKYGYLYQGQHYQWQKQRRGRSSLKTRTNAFVTYLETHDQVANYACGQRVYRLTSPGRYRAMATALLLSPQTPMFFQGQDFCSSKRFNYFADHEPDLGKLVSEGRKKFQAQWPNVATEAMQNHLPDPTALKTFLLSKLDHGERDMHLSVVKMHKELLRIRREDPVIRRARLERSVDGAVLGPETFLLRYFGEADGDDRLLVVNLGPANVISPMPEPLAAPPLGCEWIVEFSTEAPEFGGLGTMETETPKGWNVQGHAAVLLKPAPCRPEPKSAQQEVAPE